MTVPPRRVADQTLAFGKGRLAMIVEDGVKVLGLPDLVEAVHLPVHSPLAVVGVANGSLLIVAPGSSLLLLPDQSRPRPRRRLMVLPGATIFPDRHDPTRVWVTTGGAPVILGYDLEGDPAQLVPERWIELDGYDGRLTGSLADGSFLYSTAEGLANFFGSGPKHAVVADVHDAVRLLPSSRPDTFWMVQADGAVLERLLLGKTYSLSKVGFQTAVFEAEAAGEYLAVLELAQPAAAPWTFVLEVFDVRGKRRLRALLPASESVAPNWMNDLTRDRHLALTADPPRVAVGGAAELFVWAADTGVRLFAAP